jgi:hypothetical protein
MESSAVARPSLQVMKDIVKSLPHPMLVRAYNYWHVREQRPRLHEVARKAGVPLTSELRLAELRKSDTACILGSGPSINRISRSRWEAIAATDSMGLNFWPFHPFTPKFYFFESIVPFSAADSVPQHMYPMVRKMLADAAVRYRDVIKIITDLKALDQTQLIYQLPAELHTNLWTAFTVPVIARNAEEFKRGIRYIKARGALQKADKFDWIFKYNGSITGMIDFCLKMDYRRIVLCGVDMKEQLYFYQDRQLFPDICDLEFVDRKLVHHTARPQEWMVGMADVLAIMKKEILDPAGVELYIETTDSALYPALPVVPESVLAR